VFLQVQGRLPRPSTTNVASRVPHGATKLPKQEAGIWWGCSRNWDSPWPM